MVADSTTAEFERVAADNGPIEIGAFEEYAWASAAAG